MRERLVDRSVRLFLTCHLEPGKNPGAYRPDATRDLVKNLGVSDIVMELGAIPYHNLHRLYASADVYISPAYTETFAHPLVEAMASGVPVVASDIAVHREICGDAAVYFERFSPDALAACVMQIAEPSEMRRQRVADGLERVGDFSWKTHVEQILELSRELLRSKGSRPETEL
ncbi:MAG: hypothetical protein DMG78_19550 [Acidobacteria bacterium]|nr:MAG: hypothetical protein DMG78_19550 [Acidobacteriota bacterium]